MYNMSFIILTLFAWAANACFVYLVFMSIQQGQWLDKLLNWQNKLTAWDMQGGKSFLVKAGGACELCFCHFLTTVLFWGYCFIMNIGFDTWHGVSGVVSIPVNIVWYLSYVSIGTVLSVRLIKSMNT